jgi:hypothetical protein
MDFFIVIKNEINKKKIKKTYVRLFENKFGKVPKASRPSEMVMLCYNTLLPGAMVVFCYNTLLPDAMVMLCYNTA